MTCGDFQQNRSPSLRLHGAGEARRGGAGRRRLVRIERHGDDAAEWSRRLGDREPVAFPGDDAVRFQRLKARADRKGLGGRRRRQDRGDIDGPPAQQFADRGADDALPRRQRETPCSRQRLTVDPAVIIGKALGVLGVKTANLADRRGAEAERGVGDVFGEPLKVPPEASLEVGFDERALSGLA